jgi:hypothetical protein
MATEASPPSPAAGGAPRPTEAAAAEASVPFPRYSVALVQNESEMLQAPSYDLHTFLEQDRVFDVELFTERSFHALPGESARFECVVIGYNAAHKSGLIRKALEEQPPTTGLCVLHQLAEDGLAFLGGDVGAELRQLRRPGGEVHVAHGRDPEEEILLNWPAKVPLAGGVVPGASVHCGVEPAPESNWRTVLEIEHDGRVYPVLLRTPTHRASPVVVCTVLLSQARRHHAALLRNLLTWCVGGRPDVVVVQAPDDRRAATVHRKLRLQGSKAIAYEVDSPTDLDFMSWPLRGVPNVILPAAWNPEAMGDADGAPGLGDWLEQDGRIVSVEDNGNLVMRHGASDARWVARQWGAWFTSEPPATWHGERPEDGSLVRTRAVLGALVALRGQLGATTADRLGLPVPRQYAEPCAALLKKCLGRGTNVDGTVSATTAALEIDRAVGDEGVGAIQAPRIRRWLRTQARKRDERDRPVLAAEDRLEVARCLGDRELVLDVAKDLVRERTDPNRVDPPKPLAAILVTKLREAAVMSGLKPGEIPNELAAAPRSVEADVRESPLLAANYLIALRALEQHWPGSPDPLVREDPEAIDRVIIAIGKHGVLVRGRADEVEQPHELVSAEALALLAYFHRYEAATHMLPGAGETPPEVVQALVQEARQLRALNARIPSLERALFWGKGIVGVLAILIVAALTVAVVRLGGGTVPVIGDVVVAAVLLAGANWLLNQLGLLPGWLSRFARWASERAGFSGSEEPAPEPRRPPSA